ncbi:GNAT family N-acetyltransferase [Amycolatopsis rubida]|uniref:GNAT family N-acetyltransferase n=1 Tax=Amycolatopsis rubida TaxID=112413 RepID=A0ABX0C019_9PSEU|nr:MULTISPECIES: GNAT family protein [Amycolatopsis]MYW96030.1 GNAT family N-acetyltransferase [Amycolatopsis rubida]NEC61021.1 GNAT family N-acetyltransferase [Amycolatopsis rubida]OAP20541.1 putative ribosomal N-acetyltransferase YdaF [Amycolatopsis sp. M39]
MNQNGAGTSVSLSGALTSLREFRSSDGAAAFEIVGDDRVTRFLSFDSRSRDAAQAMIDGAVGRATVQPRNEYYLGMTRLGDDQLIGFCRLGLTGVRAAKLGYAVAAEYWGRGYATDAVRTVLEFAFGPLDLHRVTAAIGPDNAASQAVVERLGFVREGVLRDHVFTNDDWRDSVLYSALSDEWPAQVRS